MLKLITQQLLYLTNGSKQEQRLENKLFFSLDFQRSSKFNDKKKICKRLSLLQRRKHFLSNTGEATWMNKHTRFGILYNVTKLKTLEWLELFPCFLGACVAEQSGMSVPPPALPTGPYTLFIPFPMRQANTVMTILGFTSTRSSGRAYTLAPIFRAIEMAYFALLSFSSLFRFSVFKRS